MESADLRHIWKNGNEPESRKYSLADIQLYRKKKSRQAARSGLLSILFDIGYKAVVVLGLALFLILVKQTSYQVIAATMIVATLGLIWTEVEYIKKLKRIKETDSVIDNLKNQLSFLKNIYGKFVYIGALSNPLFVLTGFLLYHYFKYGEIQIQNPLTDPITYAFLILAYGISIMGQLPFHKKQIREVSASIEYIDDEYMASIQLEDEQKSKTKNMIMFSILILIGVLVTLVLLLN